MLEEDEIKKGTGRLRLPVPNNWMPKWHLPYQMMVEKLLNVSSDTVIL